MNRIVVIGCSGSGKSTLTRDLAALDLGRRFFDNAGPARLERADVVVLFDLPTVLCLYRAVKRWLTYRGETRPDLAPGCPEKFDLEFYRYILTYRSKQLPQAEALIARYFNGRVVRVRNEAERAAFVGEVA